MGRTTATSLCTVAFIFYGFCLLILGNLRVRPSAISLFNFISTTYDLQTGHLQLAYVWLYSFFMASAFGLIVI
jgi:hypothetical protein